MEDRRITDRRAQLETYRAAYAETYNAHLDQATLEATDPVLIRLRAGQPAPDLEPLTPEDMVPDETGDRFGCQLVVDLDRAAPEQAVMVGLYKMRRHMDRAIAHRGIPAGEARPVRFRIIADTVLPARRG